MPKNKRESKIKPSGGKVSLTIPNPAGSRQGKNLEKISKFDGVYWQPTRGLWIGQYTKNGKSVYVGGHPTDFEASAAVAKSVNEPPTRREILFDWEAIEALAGLEELTPFITEPAQFFRISRTKFRLRRLLDMRNGNGSQKGTAGK